jgi:hypothetical protein
MNNRDLNQLAHGYSLIHSKNSSFELPLEEAVKFGYNEAIVKTNHDIRNKLSPVKNLIAMIENGLIKGTAETHPLIIAEIEQCKKSIQQLINQS